MPPVSPSFSRAARPVLHCAGVLPLLPGSAQPCTSVAGVVTPVTSRVGIFFAVSLGWRPLHAFYCTSLGEPFTRSQSGGVWRNGPGSAAPRLFSLSKQKKPAETCTSHTGVVHYSSSQNTSCSPQSCENSFPRLFSFSGIAYPGNTRVWKGAASPVANRVGFFARCDLGNAVPDRFSNSNLTQNTSYYE